MSRDIYIIMVIQPFSIAGILLPMLFHEKLRRWIGDKKINQAEAERTYRMRRGTIGGVLSQPNSYPRVDIAFKIARAVGLDIDFLMDDYRPYPPADDEKLRAIDTYALFKEAVKRQRAVNLRMWVAIEEAEKINWTELLNEVLKLPPHAKLKADDRMSLLFYLWSSESRFKAYDLDDPPSSMLVGLPGGELVIHELTTGRLRERIKKIEKNPGFSGIKKILLEDRRGRDLESLRDIFEHEGKAELAINRKLDRTMPSALRPMRPRKS